MEEVQQAGDLEDPHGAPEGVVDGEMTPLFAQAMLGIDQGGDARAVDEGKVGEVQHDLLGPVLHERTQDPGQFRRGGHVQLTGQEDHGVAVEADDLGGKAFCRGAHGRPIPKVPPSEITHSLLVHRLAPCGPVFSRHAESYPTPRAANGVDPPQPGWPAPGAERFRPGGAG